MVIQGSVINVLVVFPFLGEGSIGSVIKVSVNELHIRLVLSCELVEEILELKILLCSHLSEICFGFVVNRTHLDYLP